METTTKSSKSVDSYLITIYVMIGFFVLLIAISFAVYCYLLIKRRGEEAKKKEAEYKVPGGRSTDIDLFNKSHEKLYPKNVKTIRNQVFNEMESTSTLNKYKSDSVDSIDTNGQMSAKDN